MGMISDISLTSVIVQNASHLFADISGEVVLLNVALGEYFGFNEVASDVWRRLSAPVQVADLCAALSSEYEIESSVIEQDVQTLLAQLADKGLIEVLQ